jgi:hypothetical protein
VTAIWDNAGIDTENLDEPTVRAFIERLRVIERSEDEPAHLRSIAAWGATTLTEMLEASLNGNAAKVRELWLGAPGDGGQRPRDGYAQVLPRWARGIAILDALIGKVVVDETTSPPRVTIHAEAVPRKLRPEAMSLAAELVDAYSPRPVGGRPRTRVTPETG